MNLDDVQAASMRQFDRQSNRYGKSHILADVSDVEEGLSHIPFAPHQRALDVATGGGHTGLLLAARGYRVTLGDIAPGMLETAAALAAERGLQVETSRFTAENIPFPENTFALVTCRVAAHHFSSPAAFVEEVHRVLTPGGHFLLIDGSIDDGQPEAEAWLHRVEKWRDPSHGRFLTQGNWEALCREKGLAIVHSALHPLKQPDLEWYFETAATTPENCARVLEAVHTASPAVRRYLRLGEEDGRIVWWWPRLTLVARRHPTIEQSQ